MIRRSLLFLMIAGVFGAAGCHKKASNQWRIVADNKSASPCEISMDIGPGAGLNAPAMEANNRTVLMSGNTDLTVRTVKVVWKKQQKVFSPKLAVPVGKDFVLSIGADGEVSSAVVEQ